MLRYGGIAAVERGWHALIFDGPGQGAALYDQGLPFRPDWEAVITPVVDFALARPGVDPAPIALARRQPGWLLGAARRRLRAPPRRHRRRPRRHAGLDAAGTQNCPRSLAALDSATREAEFDAGVAAGLAHAPAAVRFELAKRGEPYRITVALRPAARGADATT